MYVHLFRKKGHNFGTSVSTLFHIESIPVKSHGFAVSLTVLTIKSWSHADYVISHAFQL